MAINYELLNRGVIALGGNNFELLGEKPLDSRSVVPTLEGLETLIDNAAAYAGMIVYVESENKHYQVNADKSYREFGLTTEELNDIITNATTAAMEFKGATASLPAVGVKGDMYKVSASFEVAAEDDAQGVGFTTKIGDSIVCSVTPTEEGAEDIKWYLIPSGDDIEDTWRPITNVDNDSSLTFAAGANLGVEVKADGTVTYAHGTVADPTVTAETETVRTYITSVETDGYGHITGYKTATENVEDTNTTYEFECQTGEEHTNVFFKVKASDAEQEQEVCLDAYTQKEVDDKITAVNNKIDSIDYTGFKTKQEEYSATGSTVKTVTSVTQDANGEIEVTYSDIDFTHDHDNQYKKLQTAINAVATEKNVFIDTVAQNANGEITITTKSIDLTDVDTSLSSKIDNANGTITTSTNSNGDATELNVNGSVILATSQEKGWITLGSGDDKVITIDQESIAGVKYAEILTTEDADTINNRINAVEDIAEAALPEYSEEYKKRVYWGTCVGGTGLVVAEANSSEATHDSSKCTVISDEAISFHDGYQETSVAYSHAGIKLANGDTLSFPELSGCLVVDSQLEDLSTNVSESIQQIANDLDSFGHTFDAYTESNAEIISGIQDTQNQHINDIGDINSRIDTVEETATSNLAEAKAYADGKVADFERAIDVQMTGDGEGGQFLDGVQIDAGYGSIALNATGGNITLNSGMWVNVNAEAINLNNKALATEEYVDGKVAEVQNAVDAIDVGVTKIVAGTDIVVTPAEGTGEVTIAHETFTTGTYQKSPEASDKTGDVYMMTSVTVDNGHVTGANVQSLAHALQAMSFIFDGGTSAE